MTILGGGDLAPRRRGRRRRGRAPMVLALLLVLGLAAAGWFGWQALRGGSSASSRPVVTCVTPTPSPTPVPAASVRVAVLNGTKVVGLAHTIAASLHARGFAIASVGNGPPLQGPAEIRYAATDTAAAVALAEHIPAARLTLFPTARPGVVQLRLGPQFHALATPAVAQSAHARDVLAATPSPAVCSTAHG